jgi:hypothetical protein
VIRQSLHVQQRRHSRKQDIEPIIKKREKGAGEEEELTSME